ncbi:MAG: ribosome maturation factor RimP [Clostridia bacterium]
MSEVIDKSNQLLTPIIEEMGYEVVEIEYKKQYGENNLTIYVYKKGGIALQDCENITHALDDILENNDVTSGEMYNLNISSMGLDREIKNEDDYRRNLDTDVELVFKNPLNKKVSDHGIMVSYDEESISIISKCKKTKYNKNNIVIVRPYINFK